MPRVKTPPHRTTRRVAAGRPRGFSLIELLTVVAIIGVLTALATVVVGRTRGAAKRAACQANLRQMGVAFRTYVADNRGFLPAVTKHTNADTTKGGVNTLGNWQVEISPYFGNQLKQNVQAEANEPIKQLQCPEFEVVDKNAVTRGYGMNDVLTSRGMVRALTGSTNVSNYSYNFRVRAVEVARPSITVLVSDSDSILANFATRHAGRANCVFADGHVASVTAEEGARLKAAAIAP